MLQILLIIYSLCYNCAQTFSLAASAVATIAQNDSGLSEIGFTPMYLGSWAGVLSIDIAIGIFNRDNLLQMPLIFEGSVCCKVLSNES